jgi:hypothetical protein
VSRDFWTLVFFHQKTFPSLVTHAWKGFRICLNIRGVILLVINSKTMNTPATRPKLADQKNLLVQNTLGSLTPWFICHRKSFLLTCSDDCPKSTNKSTPPLYSSQGSPDSAVYSSSGSRFTDFMEHTTIFKETNIIKIDCRLF